MSSPTPEGANNATIDRRGCMPLTWSFVRISPPMRREVSPRLADLGTRCRPLGLGHTSAGMPLGEED